MSEDAPTVQDATAGIVGGSAGDSSVFNPLPGVGGDVGAVLNPFGSMTDSNHFFNSRIGSWSNSLKSPSTPDPKAPPPPPTIGDANRVALTQELSQEQRMHAASTIMNGGGAAGLVDTPSTASRTLLGS